MPEDDASDLLTITQLKQVAGPSPQPYRVHAQVDGRSEKTTSQGSPFWEVKLADAADSLLWRVFDNSPAFQRAGELKRGDFVELAAQWIDTGKFGLEPRQPVIRVLNNDEIALLLNGSEERAARQRADHEDIVRFINGVSDPRLKNLSLLFLGRHGERFRRAAAARENHHARRGGLVEHVAQMMRCADAVCSAYPLLNRDLLIAGVLFHDCGKLWENSYPETGFNMPYNINGEMLGHIALGLELVNKLWREMMEMPAATEWTTIEPPGEHVRLHLLHLIAAHHGEHQFGSPVLPKTPEAIALHHVDNIDAKLEMLRRGYETSRELAPGIFERFRPWPVNIVAPLPGAPKPPPNTEPPPAGTTLE
ncbi:MAG: HD domain-containing protein [Verrucomicrobiaceae bacterium]|nr:HD domain-containing protein [Verrucomicrobiaceae bacterium]